MRRFTCSIAGALALAACAAAQDASPILSQPDPDSPIGARNLNGPAGLAQFDFVVGDWDVDITFTPPGGAPIAYKAKWHNIWIVDGQVVMQEWRGPYATGAELRAYDPATDTWVGRNIYAGRGWKPTTATRDADTMTVVIDGGADARGDFLNRETYFNIADDTFEMRSERSYDDGETWEPGAYVMRAARAAAE